MIKFKKREKIIFGFVVCLLAFFFIDKIVLSGFRTKIAELNKKIKLEEAIAKKGISIQKNKDKIAQEYQTYSKYLTFETQERDIVAKLLREIEKITQESGISVLNLAPQDKFEQNPEYNKCSADLRLEGNTEQLLGFLNRIQNSNLLIKLDKLSISSRDEQATTLRIDITVSLIIPN
ncbi:MAG: type 4a pilus biogenesis protein PilO [Candidatus Omnitrophica bacterium]|nr:type 4a pilus biogenesis protein PilO [Candidatus Omnitrophota bacterium]